MPNLKYKACGFPARLGSQLTGSHTVDIPWPELVSAAITVGRESWAEVFQHGFHSRLEMIYRFAILRANLCSSPEGGFAKTDAYNNLDSSEKSAISYFQGLSFAKLAAQRLFRIPWLVHLDSFPDERTELRGNQRPDLIGLDGGGQWCVFEAKGRTRIHNETIRKAKEQTRCLRKIDGSDPSIRVASISHFSDDMLELRLEHADEIRSGAGKLDFPGGEDQFLKRYYQPLLSLISNDPARREGTETRMTDVDSFGNRQVDVVLLDEVDLVVGLDSLVLGALKSASQQRDVVANEDRLRVRLAEQSKGISELLAGNQLAAPLKGGNTRFLGLDGVYIRLESSWDT